MNENETLFWNRILELARDRVKSTTYDFYIGGTQLVSVTNQTATVFLPTKMLRLFWEQNLEDIVIMAGFEIFGKQLHIAYQFGDDVLQQAPITQPAQQSSAPQQATSTPTVPQQRQQYPSNLNTNYTFDSFVQGDGNQWAVAAALAVSDRPGTRYNPLFIHGGSGLGKTHLANAIGNAILQENPDARVLYVASVDFLDDMIRYTRTENMQAFKEKYRNVDVLLIDDIQFIAGKPGTQDEFFQTFEVLYKAQKQIVLTSDRNPDELGDIEDRLVTRFKWGLMVEITPPNYEMRVAILLNKIRQYPYDFPEETINYIARQFDQSIRDLEGALNKINLIASVQQIHTITLDVAAQALRTSDQETERKKVISIKSIQQAVGKFYGLTQEQIIGTKRTQAVVLARQVAMYLAREMTDNSLPKIGKEFGGRDHSTVLHAYHKIQKSLAEDEALKLEVANIQDNIT